MDRLQLAVERPERVEALPDLEPGTGHQHQRDRSEDEDHIALESGAERIDLLMVERDVEFEGSSAQGDRAAQNVGSRIVRSCDLERATVVVGAGAVAGVERHVPQRTRGGDRRTVLHDLPIGAAVGLVVARVCQVACKHRRSVCIEHQRGGQFVPAHLQVLVDPLQNLPLENRTRARGPPPPASRRSTPPRRQEGGDAATAQPSASQASTT